MAFQEVQDLGCDSTTSLGGTNRQTGKKNPTSAEGFYLGKRSVTGSKGESSLYVFRTPKGNLGVWGKTDLDSKMKAVKPGLMTRVTFDGMQKTKKGDMYKYKVAVDPENAIEVESYYDGSAASSNNTDYNETEGLDTSDDDTEDSVSKLFAK